MDHYKASIFVIKILGYFIPVKKYRKLFRNFLNKKFKVDYKKNIETLNYLKKYTSIDNTASATESIYYNKLPIWQLWFQGEDNAPEIVKRCLVSVKQYSGGRDVIILTKENISQYVDIPKFIMEKKEKGVISNTHFSDILRICLLEKYGGTWIDSTVFLTDFIPENILDSNFFAFAVPESHINYGVHLFSSWFIHCQPNSKLLKSIRLSLFNYWEHENILIDYFTLHLIIYNVVHADYDLEKMWYSGLLIDNIAPHKLQFSLKDRYDENKLTNIKKDSSVHKLTYKIQNDVLDSFLDCFLKNKF